jgi:hypothetical protein
MICNNLELVEQSNFDLFQLASILVRPPFCPLVWGTGSHWQCSSQSVTPTIPRPQSLICSLAGPCQAPARNSRELCAQQCNPLLFGAARELISLGCLGRTLNFSLSRPRHLQASYPLFDIWYFSTLFLRRISTPASVTVQSHSSLSLDPSNAFQV